MARRPAISLALPVHAVPFEQTLAAARAAERAGLDGVWVPDHLLNTARAEAGVLECWTTLAAVAAATSRVFVGTLVLMAPFRQAALLAKQAATLDAIAPGRVRLGLGAGGYTYAETADALGFPRLPGTARVACVEETVQCLRVLWRDDPASFSGSFARAQGARLYPRPASPIPIVLAARRPRMLELTARLADGWNCPLPEELESGLAALERHGRERHSIEVSVYTVAVCAASEPEARRALARAGRAARRFGDVEKHHLYGAPDRLLERIASFARRGADHLALDVRGTPIDETLDLLAREVLPRLERD